MCASFVPFRATAGLLRLNSFQREKTKTIEISDFDFVTLFVGVNLYSNDWREIKDKLLTG
jgi:hypothetical protein